MSRRARSEAGFTVIEVMVTMLVLAIVVAGAMTMMQVVLRQSRGTVQRTDAMQRGRLVMDTLTREIRSQVCLDATTYGLTAASPNSITFYADFSDGTPPEPKLRTLTYNPTRREITRTTTNPTQTVVVLDNVKAPAGGMFAYSAYVKDTFPPELAPPMSSADLAITSERNRVARIDIGFEVLPTNERTDDFGTTINDSVVLRTADPNATKPDPTCR